MINKNYIKILVQASIQAGKEIMSVYNSDFHVEKKDDKSPLTEADKRANDVINVFLKDTGIPIISEENKQIDYQERKKWTSCWIVDPLDGTKEFIKRNGEFTVNIALVTEGQPTIGVIYVPVVKTLYIGDVVEKKSYKVTLDSEETSVEDILKNVIEIAPRSKGDKTVRIVGSRSHMSKETLEYMEKEKNLGKQVEIVSKGSSLKFCLVAEGEADVYPRFAPTMEWDTAAGHAICKAVGLHVIDETTQKELLYNKENLLNPWFICK